jgi:hypothetical protein
MQGSDDRSILPYRNAFTHPFLQRLGELDEPPSAGEADVAGPWDVEEIPGFGLFRKGERARAAASPLPRSSPVGGPVGCLGGPRVAGGSAMNSLRATAIQLCAARIQLCNTNDLAQQHSDRAQQRSRAAL